MAIVPAPSAPLFAFASDGSVAWLRESGSRLVAVDTKTGEILREVRLDPAPFGIGWRVERHGAFFVVRDDKEIAAYDDATGARLWKRTAPTPVAFVGERDGRHISVLPGPDSVLIALADLATGAFEAKLTVRGSMRFIGAHGTIADDLLFFATDEREVIAIDIEDWRLVQRHRMAGSQILPPVATWSGVHVASVEQADTGAVTHVATLDRVTGFLVSSLTMPGNAHLLAAGTKGLVLETRRSPNGPVERIAFRPESPSVRLRVAKHVDMRLVRNDAPSSPLLAAAESGTLEVHEAVRAVTPARNEEGRRDEMLPGPRERAEPPTVTGREGLIGLLSLLEARSEVLPRLGDAYEGHHAVLVKLQRLGITLRDPRVRWSASAGRDPCLIDIAENRDGDGIATYFYPARPMGDPLDRVPVVLVTRATGEARWLADDFDVWFAGVLHNAADYAPETVKIVVHELALARDFPRPLAHATPPPWFFEAHATEWTIDDADTAVAAGDVEGAERMLVAIGRKNGAGVKERLAAVYTTLGWEHHRATVVETW